MKVRAAMSCTSAELTNGLWSSAAMMQPFWPRAHLILGLLAFAAVTTVAVLCLGLWASHFPLLRLDQMDAALARYPDGEIKARNFESQQTKAKVSVQVFNRMTELGRPRSQRTV